MKQRLLLIAVLLSIVLAGRIYNGDIYIDYANAGKMTTLSFSFMLSNSITNTDYLKVALPFPFHSSLTPAVPAIEGLSSPSMLLITYQTINSATSTLNPTVYNTFILTQTIDSSNYYIRFYDATNLNLIPIVAGTWYFLTFKILDSNAMQYQMANSILQIQLSTVSSVWTNSIVYDDNLAFQYFQLASSPSNLISLASTPTGYSGNNGYLLTQASYNLFLDVNISIPSYQYTENLVLKFLVTDNRFLWNSAGACSSVSKTTSPTISAINSSLYTCSFDTINNIFIVTLLTTALTTQTIFRFQVGVINPSIVIQNVGIEVRAMKVTESTILGYGSVSNALNTNPLYVTYQQIFLGWGLRPDALLPFQANIYRGNSASPTYMPYNSLSVKFCISQSTASNLQLKIVIGIPSQASAFVLQNGFSHNLPAATNKVVVCQTEYASSTTNRSIGCTGVGQLLATNTYTIGWKMFFPYDNYVSSYNCTQFGTVTVYSMQTINATDNSFILGRGNDFLAYLSTLNSVNLIGRNSSYITYMQTFFNLNLIVRSRDFQQFLTTPQSIYVTNRPTTYSNKLNGYDDVYVVSQNLAFLTYIGLFSDIYIAYRLKGSSSDIIKGYDSNPLVATSVPKNTLTITSVNSKDWSQGNTSPLVSSVTGQTSTSVKGINLYSNNQSLVFSLTAAWADISNYSSTSGTTLPNYSGLMIMMNPTLVNTSATLTLVGGGTYSKVSGYTMTSASSYNQYSFIAITANRSDGLTLFFNGAKQNFGVYPFQINTQPPSLYGGDTYNMDFYMAACDGINGPLNKIVYNGYFLVNAYSQTGSTSSVYINFVNYYASTTPLDGSTVPTFLKVTGSFSDTSVTVLGIFFDYLTPFYRNMYTNEIYCFGTDSAITGLCNYKPGANSQSAVNNYNTMSMISVPLAAPSTTFTIYIPVVIPSGYTQSNTYVGGFYTNNLNNKTSFPVLKYISLIQTTSLFTLGSSLSTGTFGPDVTASTVGTSVSNLVLKANYGGALTKNTAATSGSLGATYSYFSQWDLFGSSTFSGWTFGSCYKISYLYYNTNYANYIASSATFTSAYYSMNGIVCSLDSSSSVSTASVTISSGSIPYNWGCVVPGYGGYSTATGQLMALSASYATINTPLTATATYPTMGPSMANAIVQWNIQLPALISKSVLITIKSTGSTNLPFTATGTCVVYSYSTLAVYTLLPVTCNYASNFLQLNYTLNILQSVFNTGDTLVIYHYGMTTLSTNTSVAVTLNCYSLATTAASSVTASQIIFTVASQNIAWNSSLSPSSLVLNGFSTTIQNSNVASPFSVNFTLTNKGLYITNRIRINLGQYNTDNSGSTLNPTCVVFQYTNTNQQIYSHDFGAIDTSQGYNKLQLWPKGNLFGSTLQYTVSCYNFLTSSSPNPTAMSALVVNTSSDLTGELSTTTNVSIPVLTGLGLSSTGSLSKNYLTPSTLMEMSFSFVSVGIDYNTILFIGFPNYYANGLGGVISCYNGNTQIYCSVSNRLLTIKYIGTYASGTTFTVTVVGVSQPINYNSGTFYYIMDFNNVLTTVNCAGTFADTVSSTVLQIQNFPFIRIAQFTQSSSYIRDTGVTLTFQFYLASSLSTLTIGQNMIVTFPPIYIDILRFASPTCTFTITTNTLKNYVNTCSVRGIRLIIPLIDTLVLGSSYILTISNLINPTAMSPNTYRYGIQFGDSSNTYIVLKTFSPQGNYIMPIFVQNTNLVYLNYYDNNGNQLSTIYTYAAVQSSAVYFSPASTIATSQFNRNTYFSCSSSSVLTNPATISVASGSNPIPITFSTTTSGVQYMYFTKNGDGSYYSNLPPLTLITDLNYYQAVSLLNTAYSLPVGIINTNYTLVVTLPTTLYPMTSVNMTVTIPTNNGVSLKINPTVITFTSTQPSATILLYVNDVTLWVQGATTTLLITPASTYSGTVTVTLTAVASQGSTVTASVTPISNALQQKYYTFNVQCSDYGYFYYHIERTFTYNTSACTLNLAMIKSYAQASSTSGLRVAETYFDCEDQFGILNVPAVNTNQLLTINNLLTTTSYLITGFCQNQVGVDSSIVTASFTTISNTGVISEMMFTFASPLTVQQKIKLVCYLALQFNINYQKVSTYDGYYCSELLSRRRRLLSQAKRILTATNPNNLIVYFGISTSLNTDTSSSIVSAASTLTALNASVNTGIVGIPTLNSYTTSSNAYIGANDFTNPSSIFVDIGPTYVYAYNLILPHNGLIYAILGDMTLWPRDPLITEIKTGSGPNGLGSVGFRVLAYRSSDSMSGYLAFTNLPTGTYKLYLVASDENPFDTCTLGSIQSYSVTNQVPSSELRLFCSLIVLAMLLWQ